MKSQYFYLAGAVATLIGFIVFKIQQKRNKKANSKRDYSHIDLSKEYSYAPNYKQALIEWIVILIFAITFYLYSLNNSTDSKEISLTPAVIICLILFLLWSAIFLLFNSQKIVFYYDHFEIYSFLSSSPIKIRWENIDTIEYLMQNDKVRFWEKKPIENRSRAGLMHYSFKDQMAIKILLDANLKKFDKELEFKYW